MPKQSDIVGTIRVPEEHYGRFWNFMRSMPTAEFSPQVTASGPNGAKKGPKGKDSEGSSSKCIALSAIIAHGAPLSTAGFVSAMLNNNRSRHVGSLIDRLLKEKMITRTKAGYNITAAGRKFHATSCPVE